MSNERGEKFTVPGLESGCLIYRTDTLLTEPTGQTCQEIFTFINFQQLDYYHEAASILNRVQRLKQHENHSENLYDYLTLIRVQAW